jgi:DNA-binding MarR family transcriptional regulator
VESAVVGDTDDSDPVPSIEAELALLLRRAEATRRAGSQAHRALDRAAYVILRHLEASGPTQVGAIAAALGVDASTATRQIAAMERDSLVRRDADPRDGRATVISATATGRAKYRSVRRARAQLYERVLADWSPADRRMLAAILHRLNESLDAHTRAV